jgi:limonene-1,2-epoxide hydrolase
MLDIVGQKILRHRGWWIVFMVIVPLLSVTTGIYAGFSYANRATPDKTLTTFCNAMKSGNALEAYNQYSVKYQHVYVRQQFASDLVADEVISCSYGSVSLSGNTALAKLKLIFASGVTDSDTVTLSQDDSSRNEWRIDSEVNLSPGGMLATFCDALKRGDYRTAYARFVEQYQHRYPAQQFAADLFVDKIVSCTYGSISISGRDGLALVTFAYRSGVVDNDVVTLNQDATDTWKIENGIKLATPRKTLSVFCSTMQRGDYQTAYDQFSSDFQDLVPEQEFAAIFAQNKVISCTYGPLSVSGTNATAMLKLANTASLAYSDIVTLVQQGGNDWKINRVVLR